VPSSSAVTAEPETPDVRGCGIDHRRESRPGHLEDADLIDRPETVLHRPQDAVVERALALEVEHRVHDVLERPGSRDAAALGHMADEQHRRSGLLGEPHQPRRAFPHLTHVARRALELVRVRGLDRVDEHHAGLERARVVHDRFQPCLAQRVHRAGVDREPLGAQPDLVGRFFARDVQCGNPGALEARGALQQQGGLANAGLAADEDDRSRNDAPAEDVVELVEAGPPPLGPPHPHGRQADGR